MSFDAQSREASVAVSLHHQALVDDVVAHLAVCRPDAPREGQTDFVDRCRRDVGYHFDYLREALAASDPSLFVHYAGWVRTLLVGLGLPAEATIDTLRAMRDAIKTDLSGAPGEIAASFVTVALRHVESSHDQPPSYLVHDTPLGQLGQEYLARLLQGDRRKATALIMNAVESGISVRDLYIQVFQPSQQEVGRLWQLNQVSVAQEHYCTAATQLIMSQLYPYIFSTARVGRRMVATSVGGELHEIGIRMVADFFEMEGWDTFYLGANTPAESVVQAVAEYDAELLAVSVTLTPHIPKAAQLIDLVHHSALHPKIMVGGYPFNVSPHLWQKVNADGFAPSADEAVKVGLQLVA
jgi:MerR family transcriptional regulator, light-induced transcriptional regulator